MLRRARRRAPPAAGRRRARRRSARPAPRASPIAACRSRQAAWNASERDCTLAGTTTGRKTSSVEPCPRSRGHRSRAPPRPRPRCRTSCRCGSPASGDPPAAERAPRHAARAPFSMSTTAGSSAAFETFGRTGSRPSPSIRKFWSRSPPSSDAVPSTPKSRRSRRGATASPKGLARRRSRRARRPTPDVGEMGTPGGFADYGGDATIGLRKESG